MKKVLLKILSIYMWSHAVVGLFFGITVLFTEENMLFPALIATLTVILIFAFLGRLFWKLSSSNNKKRVLMKRNNIRDNRTENESPIKVSATFHKETPNETLMNMRKYYSSMQAEGDIRILTESVDLIKTTSNIETFISRYDLAQRTALTLEQAMQAGIKIPSNFISFRELSALKQTLAPIILKETYKTTKENALKLKTEKGQLNRFQKLYDLLVENDIFFEEFDEYDEILDSLNKDIEGYSTIKFGG